MTEKRRILVVDDHPENLVAFVAALQHPQLDVVTAGSGTEALRCVLAEDYDVVLLDVQMPDIDGYEVTALMKQRARTRNVPIVLFTAGYDHTTSQRGYAVGAVDFLAKPVDPDALRGKVLALAALHDDAERERAEAVRRADDERRHGEERLRNLADHVPNIVFTARPDGAFASLNRRWERTGMTVDDGLGWGWVAALHADDAGRVLEGWLGADADDEIEVPCRLRTASGDWHAHVMQVAAERDVTGRIVGWVGTFTDIEAQRLAETALRESQEQLAVARRSEAVGRIAGGVAHDFNNLLTAILGYSSVILKKLPDGDRLTPMVQAIHDTAERAGSITRQLLAYTRRQVMNPEVLDLADVVTSMERVLRPMLGDKKQLRVSLAEGPVRVRADRSQLEQVLLNLVLNARDALPDGGHIEIATLRVDADDEPKALLEVRDDGTGMDPETASHIFEPFFTTKDVGHGMGLGLSTVYGIVSQSGGTIDVDTHPGVGSTFRVVLPLAADEPPTEQDGSRLRPTGTDDGATLLLVDDDSTVRHLARDILMGLGFEVLEAIDGVDALRVAARHRGPIDVLVTDLRMPRMDGHELGRHLARARKGLRVVYMSGFPASVPLPPRDRFLAKPFTPESLAATVTEALARVP